MNVEYLTSINDYSLNKKQKIFAAVLGDKLTKSFCRENVKCTPNLKKVKTLDSLILWGIAAPKWTPEKLFL